MRQIGKLDNELHATTFRDFLYHRGIESEVESDGNGAWSVWVHDEDKLFEVVDLLNAFKANPDDKSYTLAADEAAGKRRVQEKMDLAEQRKARMRAYADAYGLKNSGWVTFALIALSIIATVLLNTRFGDSVFRMLAISFPEIAAGQVWRLATPVFMHFGILHIIFNMLWLKDLGGMIESIRGSGYFLLFAGIVAVVSNVAQYMVSGPGFGGMSGVVYGMLGYVWLQSRLNPWSGFVMHSFTMQMMLVWFVLGFTGVLGGIANTTHAVGLIAGLLWGYMDARRAVS